jgi:Niemann-Pick C1 protein
MYQSQKNAQLDDNPSGFLWRPNLVSLAGGPGYALEDVDEEWMSSAVRRHDYEYT